MTQNSLDQIKSSDLKKINTYLDDVEAQLQKFHTPREVDDIIHIIREQLFQEIELQVTLNNQFNINQIIRTNKEENKALLAGNDKDEVIFTIGKPSGNPFTRTKSQTAEKKSVHEERTEQVTSKESDFGGTGEKYHLVTAIIFTLLMLIPLEFAQGFAILIMGFYLLNLLLYAKEPTANWVRSNILIVAGFLVGFLYMVDDITSEELGLFYAFIVVPLYVIITTNHLLMSNKIMGEYRRSSWGSKFISIIFFGGLYYALLGLLCMITLVIQEEIDLAGTFFVIIISIAIFSYFFNDLQLRNWDYDLRQVISADSQISTEGVPSLQSEDGSDQSNNSAQSAQSAQASTYDRGSQITSSPLKFGSGSIAEYFGVESTHEKLRLDINKEKAHRYMNFRFLTLFRFLLLLVAGGAFGVSWFFSQSHDRWTLLYYIDLFQLEDIYGNYYNAFQNDIIEISLMIATIVFMWFVLLVTLEVLKWIPRRHIKTVMSHLILRQGVITIESLSVTPPGMKSDTYYKLLGELTLKNIISINHLEVSR